MNRKIKNNKFFLNRNKKVINENLNDLNDYSAILSEEEIKEEIRKNNKIVPLIED